MKVQELLDSKDKWTQCELARDKDGCYVKYNSPDAVKWCLIGAILKCYSSEQMKIVNRIEEIVKIDITSFNDESSYEEVMELVRRLDL